MKKPAAADVPSFREALTVWVKVALYSFGGPAGQIAVMHKFLVEEKKWINESSFLHALNYCMLLPGPEAQQLATYIGWLLHGRKGGIMAGVLASVLVTWVTFIPCFLFIFLGAPYIEYLRDNKSLTTALSGITAAVVGVVLNLGLWFTINALFGIVNEKFYHQFRLLIPDWVVR
jgi:chromate transporter